MLKQKKFQKESSHLLLISVTNHVRNQVPI